MSNHVLSYENGDELFPVVNCKGDPHHFRENGRPSRPGFYNFIAVGLTCIQNLLHKFSCDIGSFF